MTKTTKLLLGIFVILALLVPATSAQEITKNYDFTLECPVNNTVLNGVYFYNNTEYAFDNFTFSFVDIEISSNAYLLINIYEQIANTDYNLSWYPIFTGVTNYCRLDIFDLGLDDEVFNATTYPWWSRSATEERNGTTYAVVLPFYLIELKNVDSVDAVIQLDYTLSVETHGDREAEVTITPRNGTVNNIPPFWNPIVPIDDYYISKENFPFFIGVLLMSGGVIGGLLVSILMNRKEVS